MKIQILVVLLLTSFLVNAQSFSGKAIYKSHRKTDFKVDSTSAARNPEMQKMIQEKLSKMYQRTYVLDFNQMESTYKQKAKLNAPNPQAQSGGVRVFSFGGGSSNDVMYKNLKEKRYVNKVDLMSKAFLIKDEIPKYEWEMTGKTKSIGQYTVYEATWTREEENVNISMTESETKEEVKKEMETTTVWYTPEIPVSNGPANWSGLPGLILEVSDGNLTLVCTEIVLNPSEKAEIKEPKKGKVVTQEEYEKIAREKTREFMNKSRSRDGSGFQIRMGG